MCELKRVCVCRNKKEETRLVCLIKTINTVGRNVRIIVEISMKGIKRSIISELMSGPITYVETLVNLVRGAGWRYCYYTSPTRPLTPIRGVVRAFGGGHRREGGESYSCRCSDKDMCDRRKGGADLAACLVAGRNGGVIR